MTDLLDVLHRLDPVTGNPHYDDATVSGRVDTILSGARPPRPHVVSIPGGPGSPRRLPPRRKIGIAAVALVVTAVVAIAVAVATGLVRPLAGPGPATGDVDRLFGVDIDPDTITALTVVSAPSGDLTLWKASSPALGTCLAVTADSGAWTATSGVDGAWRPLASGAACLDARIDESLDGAGLTARFVHGDQQVFAGRVTTDQLGPDGAVGSLGVESSDGDADAQLAEGWFVTPPVRTGSCATLQARNRAGVVMSTDRVDPGCAHAALPDISAGSSSPEIVENTHTYSDRFTAGLSAISVRKNHTVPGIGDDETVLTLSVQFFDPCQSRPVGPVGSAVPLTRDPCLDTLSPLPRVVDLQLFYGTARTPAEQVHGPGGPDDDLTSPPTPGYVGGKVFGLVVYRTFAVPTDQLGSLTARWPGDAVHAPLVMPDAQTALR